MTSTFQVEIDGMIKDRTHDFHDRSEAIKFSKKITKANTERGITAKVTYHDASDECWRLYRNGVIIGGKNSHLFPSK